jgi:hypothetical protein
MFSAAATNSSYAAGVLGRHVLSSDVKVDYVREITGVDVASALVCRAARAPV